MAGTDYNCINTNYFDVLPVAPEIETILDYSDSFIENSTLAYEFVNTRPYKSPLKGYIGE